jgi:hypothetical protein
LDSALNIDWLDQPWSGDDAPVLTIEREIDALDRSHALTRGVVDGWKPAGDSADGGQWFRYGYGMYRWGHGHTYHFAFACQCDEALRDMGLVPGPHPRRYVRLGFILAARHLECRRPLLPVAQRLLKSDPADYTVRWCYVNLRACDYPRVTIEQTIASAEDLRRMDPKKAGAYELLGRFHRVRAGQPDLAGNPERRRAELEASAGAYSRCLELATCSEELKADIREKLKRVQASLAH